VSSGAGRTDVRRRPSNGVAVRSRLRTVLAEDLALLRVGLIRLLEAHDFDVVEALDNGPSLVRALTTHRPDVAVVDVRLPPTFTDEGLRAAIEARAQVPGLPVLVLSQYVEQLDARELLADRSRGVGYLLKDRVFNVGQFVDAVRQVPAGGTAMDPEVVAQLVSQHLRKARVAAVRGRQPPGARSARLPKRLSASAGARLHGAACGAARDTSRRSRYPSEEARAGSSSAGTTRARST
jgi:DNA-binding NarL/FixJ family response regulator